MYAPYINIWAGQIIINLENWTTRDIPTSGKNVFIICWFLQYENNENHIPKINMLMNNFHVNDLMYLVILNKCFKKIVIHEIATTSFIIHTLTHYNKQ